MQLAVAQANEARKAGAGQAGTGARVLLSLTADGAAKDLPEDGKL
jgi:hypothetical protein